MSKNFSFDPQKLVTELSYEINEATSTQDDVKTIVEFINTEMDTEEWGMTPTPRQWVILKTFYGLELTVEEISVLEQWQREERTTWDYRDKNQKYQCLILESGRRSGKSLSASVIILYEFYKLCRRKNPQKFYGMPASIPITILVLATSAQQAKETIFAQFANTIKYCHYFKPLIEKEIITVGVEAVRHRDKSINVFSGSSKSSSQVGHAIILLVMDEIARFKADGEDGEALQLWTNLGASGIGFDSDAKKLALSSAWCEGDAIEILYKQSGIEPSYLGFRLRTWDVNPRFHRQNPVVSADYNTNPRKAAVDYEGLRFADSEAFFNSTEVANCFRGRSVIEVMTQPNSSNLTIVSCESGYEGNYVYLDPSVITDSYSGAFGRSIEENGRKTVIVDGLLDWIPTVESNVSILNVQQCLTDIHDKRPFVKLGADHHNSAETVERMKLLGIDAKVYYATNKLQLEQYEIVRTLMHDGRLILPLDSQWRPNLSDELVRVQLINGLKIDHVRGKKGKKDLADAVAGLCWLIITNGNSIFNQPEVFDSLKKRYVNPEYKPPVDYGFNSSRDQLIQGQQRKSFSQFQSRFNK